MNSIQILNFLILSRYSFSYDFNDHFKLPNRKFLPLWNSHTSVCKSKWHIDINLEEYGIVANDDQKWNGDYMNIFYENAGLWPNCGTGKPENGGIPQVLHLIHNFIFLSQYLILTALFFLNVSKSVVNFNLKSRFETNCS